MAVDNIYTIYGYGNITGGIVIKYYGVVTVEENRGEVVL